MFKLPSGSTPEETRTLRTIERALNTQGPVKLPEYTVATVPDATSFSACMIFVSDETGGAVPAFSDGTDWRRVTDRSVVS